MKNKLINCYLAEFPLPLAIPRINEALILSKYKFNAPLLDIGCGDGRFTKILLGKMEGMVGFDIDPKEIERAKNENIYDDLFCGRANEMPFKDKQFKTILINSVLEHVGDLNEVIKECHRVLTDKGELILTVPTPLVSDYLFWPKFIPGYADFKRRLWQHINYFGEDEWVKRLEKAGFKVAKVEKTNSKSAIFWGDILFLTFILGPLPFFEKFLIQKKVFNDDKNGATLVIKAMRP